MFKAISIGGVVGAIIVAGLFYLSSAEPEIPTLGLAVLTAPQGGTGIGSAVAGDVGDCVTVADDSPFTYSFDTCGSGAVPSPSHPPRVGTLPRLSFSLTKESWPLLRLR